jgi:hypothetical protein
VLSAGVDAPSQSLGLVHLGLMAGLTCLAVFEPHNRLRNALLGFGLLLTLFFPWLWVRPSLMGPDASPRFVWGFFLTFLLSLALPFAVTTTVVTIVARRPRPVRLAARVGIPIVTYLLAVLASFPVSFNYALFYPLIR